ncbi:MAG: cation:proton antiporter [Candidatus Zixiibacteriota bacterium]
MLDHVVLIGLILFLGFWAARGAKLIKFPMVVGYVITGLILGESFTKLLGGHISPGLDIITLIALSLIGFGIGSQLEFRKLKKLGKSIVWITFFQALGAFLLVFLGSFLVTRSVGISLIFGALSTATAPAATSEVLREYKAKGILTTTLYAVVGLDDAFSLMFFALIMPLATSSLCQEPGGFCISTALTPFLEIGGSLLIGIIGGYLMIFIHKFAKAVEEIMIVSIGIILTFSGLSNHFHFSLILTAMTIGVVAVNFSRMKTRSIQNAMKGFAPPIYVIFFVSAGAKLDIAMLPSISILGIVYIITRAFGKYIGSYFGASVTNSNSNVKKYLGFGLLDQAGVAIGLAIAINHRLSIAGGQAAIVGQKIVNIITAAVFITMILAPIGIKYAIIKSGEAKNL